MADWLNSALRRASARDDWLAPVRDPALARLAERPWPTRKTEAWKYTPLHALAESAFTPTADGAPDIAPIDDLATLDVVFVNGVYRPALSSTDWPDGVTVEPLSEASDAGRQAWLSAMGQVKPAHHYFGLINDALVTDGCLIRVAPGVVLDRPLRVVYHAEGEASPEAHVRCLLQLGEGAQTELLEQYQGPVHSLLTGFTEMQIGANATLDHYRLHLQGGAAFNLGGAHVRLDRDARLRTTLVGFGSGLTRVDYDVVHAAPGAQADISAAYLLDGDEVFDLHSTIEHAVPHGTTQESVRGIVAGRARAVFNGRIHIHPHAQKTVAELNNRNLLMSPQAEVYTKPELEIYADDVQCAHGATVAELDRQALYYLRTRGIDETRARGMLSYGFINALIERIPCQPLARWLQPRLRQRFEAMETV